MSEPSGRTASAGAATGAVEGSHVERMLTQWVERRSGSKALAFAAARLAAAEADGHACIRLASADRHEGPAADAGLTADWIAAIRSHPWTGSGDSPTAFVLDQNDQLFYWRNWRHEQRIAAHLQARRLSRRHIDPSTLQTDLDSLFGGQEPVLVALQRQAAQQAIGARVMVLCGGPGTGKTSTVVRMLALLARTAQQAGSGTPLKIRLAAPTGKAAQRLSQAVREGRQALSRTLPADWASTLQTVPDGGAQTLHRLLRYSPSRDAFGHDREHLLDADVVVIDEASMVDLGHMRALLEALRDDALLILVGDPDQLESVAAGSVLADIVGAFETPAGAGSCAHDLVRLQHVWRADPVLGAIYAAARDGNLTQLLQAPANRLQLQQPGDPALLWGLIERWLLGAAVRPALDELAASPPPEQALKLLGRMQLLCALRSGPYGAAAINRRIETWLRQRHGCGESDWYPGRRVMVSRNDYVRGLFNGDIGVALDHGDGLKVWFEHAASDGSRELRGHWPQNLPEVAPAFCITVHKSQGSEYEHLGIILPPDPAHPLLTRQLVYTALSRARTSLALWADSDVLAAALARQASRLGGLRERLQGTHSA